MHNRSPGKSEIVKKVTKSLIFPLTVPKLLVSVNYNVAH